MKKTKVIRAIVTVGDDLSDKNLFQSKVKVENLLSNFTNMNTLLVDGGMIQYDSVKLYQTILEFIILDLPKINTSIESKQTNKVVLVYSFKQLPKDSVSIFKAFMDAHKDISFIFLLDNIDEVDKTISARCINLGLYDSIDLRHKFIRYLGGLLEEQIEKKPHRISINCGFRSGTPIMLDVNKMIVDKFYDISKYKTLYFDLATTIDCMNNLVNDISSINKTKHIETCIIVHNIQLITFDIQIAIFNILMKQMNDVSFIFISSNLSEKMELTVTSDLEFDKIDFSDDRTQQENFEKLTQILKK